MGMGGMLERRDAPGDGDPQRQRCGEQQPVVAVKLDLRQQVGGGDAEKGAGRHGKGRAEHGGLIAADESQTAKKQDGPERHDQGVDQIDEPAGPGRGPGVHHQGRDDAGIERLVEQDREEGREPGERSDVQPAVGVDRGRQRRAIGKAVDREAGEGAAPGPRAAAAVMPRWMTAVRWPGLPAIDIGDCMIVCGILAMVMATGMAVAVVPTVGRMVGVAVEGPFEQEHQKEARQNPGHRGVDLAGELQVGVGEKVEQTDAEQNSPGDREEHLHPPMAERKERDRRAAGVGGGGDQREIDREHGRKVHRRARGGQVVSLR